MKAKVLDASCGPRMFWFDKQNPVATFMDIREVSQELCDGRTLEISPDVVGDFRAMPFDDNSFSLVVFDPPHLKKAGPKSWLAAKYGKLGPDWREDLRKGFAECLRVLCPGGVLVFKWNEVQIPVSQILPLVAIPPLFGHKSGKRSNTHWILFLNPQPEESK